MPRSLQEYHTRWQEVMQQSNISEIVEAVNANCQALRSGSDNEGMFDAQADHLLIIT